MALSSNAKQLLASAPTCRILVVGDLMVDEHIWGTTSRVSPEAPVLVVDVQSETLAPGGAANVAQQLLALGANVFVAGIVGRDNAGDDLLAFLDRSGADVSAVFKAGDRPTTRKTRVIAGSQQIVRVDREVRTPLAVDQVDDFCSTIEGVFEHVDAVLFSDYEKGVFTEAIARRLLERAKAKGLIVTANPKPRSVSWFAGGDLVQLNRSEADAASRSHRFASLDELDFHVAGAELRGVLGVINLLVTRGPKGLTVFHADGTATDVPAHPVEVYDVAGAGDSTLAVATIGLAAGGDVATSVLLGNAAGGAVVRKSGVVSASVAEIEILL